jgi:hypothetical protein
MRGGRSILGYADRGGDRMRAWRAARRRCSSWGGCSRARSRSTVEAETPLNEKTVTLVRHASAGREVHGLAPVGHAGAGGRGTAHLRHRREPRRAPVRQGKTGARIATSATEAIGRRWHERCSSEARPRSTSSMAPSRQVACARSRRCRHGPSRKGEIVALARLVRLRQDLDAADDRGLRGGDLAGTIWLARARRSRRLPPASAERGDGLRGVFALPAAVGAREHRLRAEGASKAAAGEVERRVEEVAEAAGDRRCPRPLPPTSISGGQQQRASLARALIRDADAASARRADGPARAAVAGASARADQAFHQGSAG